MARSAQISGALSARGTVVAAGVLWLLRNHVSSWSETVYLETGEAWMCVVESAVVSETYKMLASVGIRGSDTN